MLKMNKLVDLKEFAKEYKLETAHTLDGTNIYYKEYLLGNSYKERIYIWEDDRRIETENATILLDDLYKWIKLGVIEQVPNEI